MRLQILPMICALCICGSMIGCGGDSPDDIIGASTQTNIARIANLYVRFQFENGGVGPADEATFKEYIRGLEPATLSRIGMSSDSIDSTFISERDSQPFKIVYGVQGGGRGATIGIVFEVDGVDGSRMVGLTSLACQEISDNAEYSKLLAGEPAAAPASGDGR